jgi:Zn-dependent M28 family amino/carboxypeptidase
VRGFEPNQFLTETRSWQQPEKKKPRHPLIEGILKEIKPERWLEDVTTLSQTNRFTKKVEGTEKTIQWLKNEFGKAGIAHVREQGFKLGSYSSSNVIATIPGKSRSDIYVLGAHFDSTSENPWNKAPGAEDNGSGTAALVEIARVLSKYPSPAEIQIVAFGAEEQGLYGSRHYVRRLFETGSAASVKGVLILDMIGFTNDHHYDVLLETSSEQEKMTDDIFTTGQLYSGLDLHRTFHYWGSDHVPFLERNMPAVLIIENDYQFYPHYHRSTDTADTISGLQGHEVLKLVTAQLLTWAHQNEATY